MLTTTCTTLDHPVHPPPWRKEIQKSLVPPRFQFPKPSEHSIESTFEISPCNARATAVFFILREIESSRSQDAKIRRKKASHDLLKERSQICHKIPFQRFLPEQLQNLCIRSVHEGLVHMSIILNGESSEFPIKSKFKGLKVFPVALPTLLYAE